MSNELNIDLNLKKKKRFKKFRRNRKREDNGCEDTQRTRTPYEDIIKDNKDFEIYYKMQDIVTDNDWQTFMACLREPLPSSFRLTSYCKSQTIALRNIIESEEFNGLIGDNDGTGGTDSVLNCIDWFPNRFAWSINRSRVEIRKSQSFRILQNFLISETDSGYISRQEAVSMIPVLLMDVQPGHHVLDMCAAPGSKTAQIIEMLHSNESTPEGVVVANDVDNKRCYMLVHQSKRLHSSSTLITNHDSGIMPDLYHNQNGQRVVLKFDRILCDAPCSGDGTIRKNYDVWMKWNVGNGNNFHGIQLRIAKRGLEMLKRDGILVYSTCSLNPIEDEAVIASLLNLCEGGAELVDVSAVLPKLKYSKGLDDWKVMTREMVSVESVGAVEDKYKSQIRESLFSPKNAKQLNLNRCLRVLPHLQNTGGFFVAVIRKTVDSLPWTPTLVPNEPIIKQEETHRNSNSRPKKKLRTHGYKEDPFIFFDKTETSWPQIKEYYGINDTFPFDRLVHRCSVGKKRNIYFLTESAKDLIANNENNIKLINGGVRLFSRTDDKVNPCGFRLTQEGLPSLFPYMNTDKVVEIDVNDAKGLLSSDNLSLDQFNDKYREQLSQLNSGCCVLVIKRSAEENNGLALTLPICCWKGKTSMRAYIARNERIHYLRLCGADVTETDARRSTESEKNKQKTKPNEDIIETQLKTTTDTLSQS